MVQQGDQEAQLRCCSLVTPVTVALFSGGARLTALSQQGASELRGDHSESLNLNNTTKEVQFFTICSHQLYEDTKKVHRVKEC